MRGRPTVAFVTEAGRDVGLGHLWRCQALAAALETQELAARFALAGERPPSVPGEWDVTRVDWTLDPALARAALAAWRPAAVCVDSYQANPRFLEGLRSVSPCLVAIDDLADRPLPVHLVVNGAYHAARLPYVRDPKTRYLLGPEYALLGAAFAASSRRAVRDEVRRVLVSLGGRVVPETVNAILGAVREALPEASVDLALGPFAEVAIPVNGRMNAHRGLASLHGLMEQADLAVTGGGVTLYECLATGTPVVAVCLADNQRPNIRELTRAGLVVSGEPSLAGAIVSAAADPARRRSLSLAGQRLVDGQGAGRVAVEIARMCAAADPSGFERPAPRPS